MTNAWLVGAGARIARDCEREVPQPARALCRITVAEVARCRPAPISGADHGTSPGEEIGDRRDAAETVIALNVWRLAFALWNRRWPNANCQLLTAGLQLT